MSNFNIKITLNNISSYILQHFHKFTKQPLQHIDAQVKYKEILDNCLAMLDSQQEEI